MAAQDNPQDEPFFLFQKGYDLFAVASLVGTVLLTVWIFYTLVQNTPPGTAGTQAYLAVQPTLTAIAGGMGDGAMADGGADAGFNEAAAMDLFQDQGCAGCHTVEGSDAGGLACPPLGQIADVAEERLADAAYAGDADSVEAYIRESIVAPNAYLVDAPEGKVYSVAGNSLMPQTFADGIDPVELDNLVAWLTSKQ